MSHNWFYAVDGQQQGPVTGAQLKMLAAQGAITQETLVWREGLGDWVEARRIPGLFPPGAATAAPGYPAPGQSSSPAYPAQPGGPAPIPGAPAAPAAPGQIPVAQAYYAPNAPPGAGPAQGYPPYGYPPGQYVPQPVGESHQGMAIAGFVLSLVFAPLGLIFSGVALSGMRRSGNEEGKGLAIAGLVVGIVFTSIWVIYLFCVGSFCMSIRHW